ncbi:hypothetical protein AB4Y45_33980 [Paraburkholderia sp. EG287A]|uniref:hypothetical protein n=1 Tax=Paraburkholderia sp. EG287A TaxID=3237012 RepID=UPI0034D21A28
MSATLPPDSNYPRHADGSDGMASPYEPARLSEEAVAGSAADSTSDFSDAVEDDRSQLLYHAGIAVAQMEEMDQAREVLLHRKGQLATMFTVAACFAMFFALALAWGLGARTPFGFFVPASAVGACAALTSFSVILATVMAHSYYQTDIIAHLLRRAYSVRKGALVDLGYELDIHVGPDESRYQPAASPAQYGE